MNYLDRLTTAQQVMTAASGQRHIAIVLVGYAITDAEEEMRDAQALANLSLKTGQRPDGFTRERLLAAARTYSELCELRDSMSCEEVA